jgi:hypothetical protein
MTGHQRADHHAYHEQPDVHRLPLREGARAGHRQSSSWSSVYSGGTSVVRV